MKYYKFKKNNACIVNCEEFFISEDDAHKKHKVGFFSSINEFETSKCHSVKELKQELFEWEFKNNVSKDFYPEAWKIIDEIIEKIGVETFEISYPDKPCIIVKVEVLDDQNECDANRIPIQYLKSAKELENKKYNFDYEVYLIDSNGLIKLKEDLGTYV